VIFPHPGLGPDRHGAANPPPVASTLRRYRGGDALVSVARRRVQPPHARSSSQRRDHGSRRRFGGGRAQWRAPTARPPRSRLGHKKALHTRRTQRRRRARRAPAALAKKGSGRRPRLALRQARDSGAHCGGSLSAPVAWVRARPTRQDQRGPVWQVRPAAVDERQRRASACAVDGTAGAGHVNGLRPSVILGAHKERCHRQDRISGHRGGGGEPRAPPPRPSRWRRRRGGGRHRGRSSPNPPPRQSCPNFRRWCGARNARRGRSRPPARRFRRSLPVPASPRCWGRLSSLRRRSAAYPSSVTAKRCSTGHGGEVR